MADRPRIAIVVPGLAEGGGVPAVATFLYRAIDQSGRYSGDLISIATSSKDPASVRFISPESWRRGPQQRSAVWQGIPFKHVGSQLAEIEVARYLPRVSLTNLLQDYDVIQVVAGTPMFAFAIASLPQPKCLSVATTILKDRQSMLNGSRGARKIWRAGMTGINVLLERFILPRMDHVFAQSEYTRKQLDGLVSKDRLSMGTPGVDTAVFRPGRYQGGGYIFSVARFSDPRKNVPMLFKTYHALKQMAASAPPLVLAGSAAPSEADWNLADHLGIIESIRFEDSPSAERLAEMYREASVFVLSSNEEGFGLVLAEAMSSGLPVISTRCGGPESVVADGRTGYLTPVGDYRAMAERLSELLRDPAKRELMGQEARRIAERRFSIEATGQAYIEVYDRLLNSVPRKVTSDSVAGAVSR